MNARKFVFSVLASASLAVLNCDGINPIDKVQVDTSYSENFEGGPEIIPDGQSDIGTPAAKDGSAARIILYGVPQYFWGKLNNGTDVPIVKITHAVSSNVVDLEIVFNPVFVDNTYGTGSIGWNPNRPHTLRDLYVSDHVQLAVSNKAGDSVWTGKLDLLSITSKSPSGYACLGPIGGDGAIFKGNVSDVLSFGSSLDDNLNYYGYHLFENSPATDSTYKPNSQYPNWQYFVVYRMTLDITAFGSSGYGEVRMTSVHASPGKNGTETILVTEKSPPVPGSSTDPFYNYRQSKPAKDLPDPQKPDSLIVPPDTTGGSGGVD